MRWHNEPEYEQDPAKRAKDRGDTKMLAFIGAVTGWKGLFPLMLIASITGSIVGVIVASRSEKGMQVAVPFGVFLGIAFLVVIFFGPTLSSWYVALLLR